MLQEEGKVYHWFYVGHRVRLYASAADIIVSLHPQASFLLTNVVSIQYTPPPNLYH